jgi:hypothetical protein
MASHQGERVMLERRANIRSHRLRAVGTLVVTARRLLFRPLARDKPIDIPLGSIQNIQVVGLVFKKVRIATQQRTYMLYLKGAEPVANLVQTLQGHLLS